MERGVQDYLAHHPGAVAALDREISKELTSGHLEDLRRLSTYLRRYLSPLVTEVLFRHEALPLLLHEHEIDSLSALILDMRGFVHATQTGDRSDHGLRGVAELLRRFFSKVVRIAFENYGLVGEFAGDRVLITFGYPSHPQLRTGGIDSDIANNTGRALRSAFAIHQLVTELQRRDSPGSSLREFEVGFGLSSGGNAWIGDIAHHGGAAREDVWRSELTIISTAVNVAARAEEMTSDPGWLGADPHTKIIVDHSVIDQIALQSSSKKCAFTNLGAISVRGLEEPVELFHLLRVDPAILPAPKQIDRGTRELVNWICERVEGAIERESASNVHRSLSSLGQAILSTRPADENAVFRQIMDQAAGSLDANVATLYRIERDSDDLVVVESKGPNSLPPGTRLPGGQGVAAMVAATGESYISADVHGSEQWRGRQLDPSIHSMMCVPLVAGDVIIGVIQVMDARKGAFGDTELTALKAFAGLAAVALENARTYERTLRDARVRSILTDAFASAVTLDDVLDGIMSAIKASFEARNATLYSIDPQTEDLVFRKILSESDNPPVPGSTLKQGTGIVGWVISNRQARRIDDATRDSEWYQRIGSDMRSIMCVPLVTRGRTLGAIQVLDKLPNRYAEGDLEQLEWLASSAALAVDNAARLDEARRKLVASEVLATWGAVSGQLTHSLGNHLRAIKYTARHELPSDDPAVRRQADKILKDVDAAMQELGKTRQPQLLQGWEPSPVDLNETVRRTVEAWAERRRALQDLDGPGRRIGLATHLIDRPLLVDTGQEILEYIVRNLLENAVRAIDECGRTDGMITVRTFVEEGGGSAWAAFTLSDTGGGIPEKDLDRIFDLSYTTRPTGMIGGYGLFWIRQNVERMGGAIRVSSAVDQGTTFSVRFPLMVDDNEGVERAHRAPLP